MQKPDNPYAKVICAFLISTRV